MKKLLLTTMLFFAVTAASFASSTPSAVDTRYIFNTTCGTTVTVIGGDGWDTTTLIFMMNFYNERDCGTLPETIIIE